MTTDNDSSSSDDDNAPMFSSPDNSDNEDGVLQQRNDNHPANDGTCTLPSSHPSQKKTVIDPFKYQAKSFSKVNTSVTAHQRSSPAWRRRNRNQTDVRPFEQQLEELERKKKVRLLTSQTNTKRKRKNATDDSDDDSDLEVWDEKITNGNAHLPSNVDNTKQDNQKNSHVSEVHSQQPEVIEVLSSSDEKSPSKAAAVQGSTCQGSPIRATPSTSTIDPPHRLSTRSTRVGLNPGISFDTKIKSPHIQDLSSDDDSDKETAGTIGSRLARQNSAPLPPSALDAMKRARIAQSHLTQAQHYHAHDVYVPVQEPDFIQRRKKTSTLSSTQNNPYSGMMAASMNLGKPLKMTCRVQLDLQGESKKSMQGLTLMIRQKEPFQILINKVAAELHLPETAKVTMMFDGIKLGAEKTPLSYDMEDGDLIDFAVKASHLVSAVGVTNGTTSGARKMKASGKCLTLKCRAIIKVTGRTKPKRKPAPLTSTAQLREHEALSFLLNHMIQAHNIPASAKVTMTFDGNPCNLERTPAMYEMASDDLIDFAVEVNNLWIRS